MLTVSNKGRLWTNLGMENSKGGKIFIWWLSSRNMLFSCCGKQQPTNWANLLWFAMGKVQIWTVEQGSPLPSNKVNLALDMDCSCGLCLPLLAWPDPRLASVLEEDQHLPAPLVLWSAMGIHKYVCQCCRSMETCYSSSTLLALVPPHRWIPHVSAISQQSLPKLQEVWGRGVVGNTSKSLCTPMVLSILEVIWVMIPQWCGGSSSCSCKRDSSLLTSYLWARYLVQVAHPGSYIQERESSHVSQIGHLGWDLAPS